MRAVVLFLQVFIDVTCELQHIDRPAAKDNGEFLVRYNHPTIFGILAFVRLDIDPEFFHDLGSCQPF